MRHLTGGKKVLAVASAIFLVATASGTALAMLDPGQGSLRSELVQRQIQQNATNQAQQSSLPTLTDTPEPHGGVSFRGTVDVIAATGWIISGRTVQVIGDTMVEVGVDVGSLVKVHAQRQADGSLVATQIELVQNGGGDHNGNSNENENENHNGNVNSNDDHGNRMKTRQNENHDHDDGNVNSNDNDQHDDGNVNSNDNGSHDDNHEHSGNDSNDQHDHQGGHTGTTPTIVVGQLKSPHKQTRPLAIVHRAIVMPRNTQATGQPVAGGCYNRGAAHHLSPD